MYIQQSNNKMKYLETKLNLANPKPSVPCCNNVGLFFFYLTFFGGKKGRVLLYCSYSSPILPHSLNCVFKIAKLVHIHTYMIMIDCHLASHLHALLNNILASY